MPPVFEAYADTEERLPYQASFVRRIRKPATFRRQERCLDLWWRGYSYNDISASVGVEVDAVKEYVRDAKRAGDPRTERRVSQRNMQALARTFRILQLAAEGYSPTEIASLLDVSKRLVQLRKNRRADA